ncbi:MAG: hypothetical protein GY703_23675 [Gammaproteobacteria bacterium]|nr:hypothetical protein [Gammaproteobacteria bacterium]
MNTPSTLSRYAFFLALASSILLHPPAAQAFSVSRFFDGPDIRYARFDANSFYQFAPGEEGEPYNPFCAPNDIETLLLHELGHAMGFLHPTFDGNCPVMQVHPDCFTIINRELDPVKGGMRAYHILGSVPHIASISRFNTETGRFETAVVGPSGPMGPDFLLAQEQGYIISMEADQEQFSMPDLPFPSF